MKRVLVLLAVLMLTACDDGGVPVAIKFPDVPADLITDCPDLAKLDPAKTTELSQVITGVTTNYVQYYDCKVKVDNWIEWYNEQKKIFNSIK